MQQSMAVLHKHKTTRPLSLVFVPATAAAAAALTRQIEDEQRSISSIGDTVEEMVHCLFFLCVFFLIKHNRC